MGGKHWRWQMVLGLALVAASALLYLWHYTLFHDAHHIWIYFVGDVAFLPIEVLLVTLILHQLLAARERQSKLKKLNMVIGVFYSEVGVELLRRLAGDDPAAARMHERLSVAGDWSGRQFDAARRAMRQEKHELGSDGASLRTTGEFLISKRGFLLRLLENPNLLEHESFTDLLWAVFHLAEELGARNDLANPGEADLAHLRGDARRVYGQLIAEWLAYLKHLKGDYPYLFSLAVRMNPFNPEARVEVTA